MSKSIDPRAKGQISLLFNRPLLASSPNELTTAFSVSPNQLHGDVVDESLHNIFHDVDLELMGLKFFCLFGINRIINIISSSCNQQT